VLYFLYESYQRYLSPVEINTTMTLLLATGGLIVNLASVYVLQGGEMSLNERGAFYHLLGDAGASVAVIVSMLVIRFTDIYLADPATAVIVAGLIVWSAIMLLRESGEIFFQQSPVEPEEVRATIGELDGIDEAYEFLDDQDFNKSKSWMKTNSIHPEVQDCDRALMWGRLVGVLTTAPINGIFAYPMQRPSVEMFRLVSIRT
jgi:Co/Zn/Cd efflux system component